MNDVFIQFNTDGHFMLTGTTFCISFTFAGDLFVPVEDMQPLESLLLDMQVRKNFGVCRVDVSHSTPKPVLSACAHGSGASPPISPLMAAARIGPSSVPSEWICPLSNRIMIDPVTGASFNGCEASCCIIPCQFKC